MKAIRLSALACVLVLAIASAFQMLVYTAQEPIIPADLTDIASRPLFHYWPLVESLGKLAHGRFGPSLGTTIGLRGFATLVPLFAGVALFVRAILARERENEAGSGEIDHAEAGR